MMKLKITYLIVLKLLLIVCIIVALPAYSTSHPVVFKAVLTRAKESNGKKIRIYNTHQGEEYVNYNVIEGAKYLQSQLKNLGYHCDVEENDFEKYKNVHQIAYHLSYTVSKMYLESAIEENGKYDLVIDFHRDSLDKKYSTLTYQNKNYAKILFVVGKSSGKYDAVYMLSKKLSDLMNEKIPDISKGIMIKQNHYNQGICDDTVLIEFGGQMNTKEEVQNTIDIVSQTIGEYLQ